MNTIRARYEVGVGDTSLEHFRLWSDASVRAVAIGGYVYDRMARKGKPQLWQAVNGDLRVQSVRQANPCVQLTGGHAGQNRTGHKPAPQITQSVGATNDNG